MGTQSDPVPGIAVPGALRTLLAVLAVVAAIVALGGTGCGPSEARRAGDAYRAQVRKRIEGEPVVWNRIAELKDELDENWSGPRYYPYLENTALPFYRDFDGSLAALEPVAAPCADAHRELRAYVASKKRFVELEIARRDRMRRAGKALSGFREKQFAADRAVDAYRQAVGPDGAMDARVADVVRLSARYFEETVAPCIDGRSDGDDVVDELRKRVLPALREMRSGRFPNDEPSERLRELLALQDESFQLLASDLPGADGKSVPVVLEFIGMQKAVAAAAAAAAEAERAREAFQKAFAALSRK